MQTIVEQIEAAIPQTTGTQPQPLIRPRRLRKSAVLRSMVQETHLHIDQLIMPLFIVEGSNRKLPIDPMPGIFQMSIDTALFEIEKIVLAGIPAVLLFGIPDNKDKQASAAWQA